MSLGKKRSRIWMHFNYVDNSRAECRVCNARLSYKAGSTNNLHRHVRIVHPLVQLDDKGQASEPATDGSATLSPATVAPHRAAAKTGRRRSGETASEGRKRSKIWMHFDYVDNTKAECRVCNVKISYRSGSTNNLLRHVRIVHPSVQLEVKTEAIEPTMSESVSLSPAAVDPFGADAQAEHWATGEEMSESMSCETMIESGSGGTMRQGRKRSKIWMHFDYVDNTKVECRVCNAKISYRSGSTNNLLRHVRLVHPLLQLGVKSQASEPAINESALLSPVTVVPRRAAAKAKRQRSGEKLIGNRKRSKIWMHFDYVDNTKVECRVCNVKLSYRSGSTNNLFRHVRILHPSVQLEEPNEGASSCTPRPVRRSMKRDPTAGAQKKIDEELAKMVARDFRPFSIVDNKGFRSFTRALNPMYVIPSKKTLSQKIIPCLFDRERASLQERVRNAPAVCLTTDCWTSQTTASSYMSVTCHFVERYKMVSCLLDCFEFSDGHTSENLAEELLKVSNEWDLENKVVCCVTDDVTNVTEAVAILNWCHHPCLAHTIDRIVRDALEVMEPTVEKVTAIVEFFHESTAATEALRSVQLQMGLPELKLKQCCKTWWNSTLHMLKRILESKDAVFCTLAALNAPVDPMSQDEWEELQEACIVLEPFEQVTVEISAESYVAASKMLILCKGLQRVTAEHQANVTTVKAIELVDTLCASMEGKFQGIEYSRILSETTMLDPRFKKLAFSESRAADEALERITALAASYGQSTPLPRCQERAEPAEGEQGEPLESAVWKFFAERATGDSTTRDPSADATLEVKSYLEEPLFQRSADPLSWWESKASVYPHLTHVMARRLCVVGASVPSERIFSKAGQIVTERRNRVNPSKLRHLVFLNANIH